VPAPIFVRPRKHTPGPISASAAISTPLSMRASPWNRHGRLCGALTLSRVHQLLGASQIRAVVHADQRVGLARHCRHARALGSAATTSVR